MNLETYLKIYAKQLIEYGYDLKEEGDAEDLEEYEEMIRIQANRLMVLQEAMEGDVTSCRAVRSIKLALNINFRRTAAGGSIQLTSGQRHCLTSRQLTLGLSIYDR